MGKLNKSKGRILRKKELRIRELREELRMHDEQLDLRVRSPEQLTCSLNVRLGPSVRKRLEDLACTKGSTPSQLVRESVLLMLANQ